MAVHFLFSFCSCDAIPPTCHVTDASFLTLCSKVATLRYLSQPKLDVSVKLFISLWTKPEVTMQTPKLDTQRASLLSAWQLDTFWHWSSSPFGRSIDSWGLNSHSVQPESWLAGCQPLKLQIFVPGVEPFACPLQVTREIIFDAEGLHSFRESGQPIALFTLNCSLQGTPVLCCAACRNGSVFLRFAGLLTRQLTNCPSMRHWHAPLITCQL